MKNFCKKITDFFITKDKKISMPAGVSLLALVINLFIESLSRHSLIKALLFVVTSPLQFLYGVLIISFTFTIALLFKRRVFAMTFVGAVWVLMGIINGVVRVFRHTPFTAQDLRLISYAYKVAPLYLEIWQMILILAGLILLIALLIVWWFKAPKLSEKINHMKIAVIVLAFWFIIWLCTNIGMSLGILARNFGNIGEAYNEYGFTYCFLSSLINSGIDKPKNYSEEAMEEILDIIEEKESVSILPVQTEPAQSAESVQNDVTDQEAPNAYDDQTDQANSSVDESEIEEKVYPNIIFVQLESLFDPDLLIGVEYSNEVLPNLSYLYSKYPTGLFSVPSVGAGTANTEFEVISGMNLDDFGPGEYPYKTVLQHKACESICYDLKPYGYTTNAVHNNDGTFYDRYIVYSQLGFDTFTSIEYMKEPERNLIGWADDSCLTEEICGILDSTEKMDFVYAVSVEGHGDYPEDYEPAEGDIIAEGEPIAEFQNAFTYYVNAVHAEDEFVGELISAIEKRDEPTVVVFYGDHLPAFDIIDDELLQGNIFTTRYVIYNNIGLERKEKDIQSFQLSALVLDMLDIDGMAVSSYHRAMFDTDDEEEYLSGLTLLEYDILYGNKEIYDGELPYSSTNLKMGYKPIEISGIKNKENHVFISGINFTSYSFVYVNDEPVESVFLDENTIFIDNCELLQGDYVTVVQKGTDGIILSGTSKFLFE